MVVCRAVGVAMLIRRTLAYLPSQIIGPAVQLVAIFAFTHAMSPDAYGIFTYVMASQEFVYLLAISWWSQYTVRYLGEHAATDDGSYARSEVPIVAGTFVLQAAAAMVSLVLISESISGALVAATVLFNVSRCTAQYFGERARAQSRVFDFALAQAGGPLIGFGLAWLAVGFIAPTPEVALAAYGIAQTAVLVWLIARADLQLVVGGPDRALVMRAFAFGLPLIAAGVAGWCGMNAIRVLIDHRLGAAAMGLVAVGWALGHRLTSTAAMLVTVAAYPLAVETLRAGSRPRAYAQITTNGLFMLGILLPATVGLCIVQGPLIQRLVAAPFRDMTLAVLPAALAAGLFRNVRTHVADQVFLLIERTGVVFAMSLVEALLVVSGCLIGLLLANPAAAAGGAAVGYGTAMIVNFVVARLVAGLALPLRGAALVTLAVAIMALVLHFLGSPTHLASNAPLAVVVVEVLLGAGVYLAAVVALFPSVARKAFSQWRQPAMR